MGNNIEISNVENPYFREIGFQLPILLGKGKISCVEGIENIKKLPNVIHIYQNYRVGDFMSKDADFSQIFCRIHICSNNIGKIKENVSYIYDNLRVFDENGNDMIICRMDVQSIGAQYGY